ncbi:histidine--tRNA ligase [Candidatus Magnetominusculus xianensis]|uniref:Histidine--tRNA ligase n=1 Tax=Candidatus Magnetominusculus xianensis TaxID=1748249 RepID=A0ABR5SJP0_9BACT|nr:histidine--tRNA ligase [Candidatus Magnetominusculus xianensis]KWT85770.1 histidine--tRNA ligase [Candidatus Magnetominusculus xianensis]MBF0405267.1 histidine--tRNA ligase [Nitrospirota bacterium]
MNAYSTLKGVHDIFPPDVFIWNKIERTAKDLFYIFGYDEIKIPIIESTEIFTRSIGQSTDIVGKEMYTFTDKGGRGITLRPEGTASVARCYVENALYRCTPPQKYYYIGPMFRYERPQKGRLRQFYQIGAECFASSTPETDAEMLFMINEFFNKLQVPELRLEINSIGCKVCRPEYNAALTMFFSQASLCGDCKTRLVKNPLRILDCKVDRCVELRKGAPVITDFLCEPCKTHHEGLRELLKGRGIAFHDNPLIVRGLDYYTRTTFEVTTEHLGAQKAVAAGGRYDNLVEEFGGPATPAIGFAIGMERLAELMRLFDPYPNSPFFYFAALGEQASAIALSLAIRLMDKNISSICADWQIPLKGHMKRANKLNAKYVIMLGADEIQKGKATWKQMSNAAQGEIDVNNVGEFIALSEQWLTRQGSND